MKQNKKEITVREKSKKTKASASSRNARKKYKK
jgi:hypothetical protein